MQRKKTEDKKLNKKLKKRLDKKINKRLLKQVLFTMAYYNALGYYPTSFFIWKNLIVVDDNGRRCSLLEVLDVLEWLEGRGLIVGVNGMYKISAQFMAHGLLAEKKSKFFHEFENLTSSKNWRLAWYKEQIQKNKISTDKIKRVKQWARMSKWVPYLRGIFLMGTLSMKRGGIKSDWDVLIVLAKNRIWLGRFFITGWFHLIGKRRHNKIIRDRFCLNQFVVESDLKFKENNEFFGNELLTMKELLGENKLHNRIFKKNEDWIKVFKPNFKIKKICLNKKKDETTKTVQKKIENILEVFKLAEIINNISKKIMIKKIINNPKTYSVKADIRYGDLFLVFLPKPQRAEIKKRALSLLTKINL
jgi:hypothetical protein